MNGLAGFNAALADRYRIDIGADGHPLELGRGGMATVYLAHDLRHDRKVAIKVLDPAVTATIGPQRFLREIGITAQLLHPHILILIESGEVDGLLYYVMPYVEGRSLRARLETSGRLSTGDGLRILRDVVDALAYSHLHGIVHRDIKPENVLLAGRHALVADFGIARAMAAASVSDGSGRKGALTTEGIAVGTPEYMAPEQAAADPGVDHRADIYSVGVLAYELFSGRPPFTGTTPQEVIAAHFTHAVEPLSRVRPDLPAAADQLVMHCLEKLPENRWQSSEDLLRRIEGLLSSDLDTLAPAARLNEPVDRTFRLTEDVCRKLNRATLDPRIIGGNLHYLDNQVESPILLCFLHGLGLEQGEFARHLQLLPHRALAPTLYGFELGTQERIPLALADHRAIIHEFLADAIRRLRPELVALVGFSSGSDFWFQMLSEDRERLSIDGLLAFGCNVSLETCFVSGLFARMKAEAPNEILQELHRLGAGMRGFDEWLNLHEYLVKILRKFRGNIEPLRRMGREVVAPFEAGGESPFIAWYRNATAQVGLVRCVFEDSEEYQKPLQDFRLRNLDEGIFGPAYDEESIVTEPGTDHFGLLRPDRLIQHVEDLLSSIRATEVERDLLKPVKDHA